MKVDIEYGGEKKPIEIFIVPSLQQVLYLGIDFWKLYHLLHSNFQVDELVLPSNDNSADQLEISAAQKLKLANVVKASQSFAKLGHLIEHSIDGGDAKPVKQRHFPVSPAVEKEMYAEIDRMLQLGVIEESNSGWSSPIVIVRKPGKI
jgi:hypothetical protein